MRGRNGCRKEVREDGMHGNGGESMWTWLEDKGESQGNRLIEGREDGEVLVGSERKNSVIYS